VNSTASSAVLIKATDVLSFPAGDEGQLGDIAISLETAARQAKENGLTFNGEIAQLIPPRITPPFWFLIMNDNGEMNKAELRFEEEVGQ
jgi:probable rRNA maturation factor